MAFDGSFLTPGEMGMRMVGGLAAFPGHLGDDPALFVRRHGRRWYVAGDLAAGEFDGLIHARGRLKRLLKAGGEMFSPPDLEEPFAVGYPPGEDGPRVAVAEA